MNKKRNVPNKKTKNLIIPDNPWTLSNKQITSKLKVVTEKGLFSDEVRQRKDKYGLNEIKKSKPKSPWVILVDQFKSLVIIILAVAAILSGIFGQIRKHCHCRSNYH